MQRVENGRGAAGDFGLDYLSGGHAVKSALPGDKQSKRGARSVCTGGAPVLRATLRVTFGGALALALTAAVGAFLGDRGVTPEMQSIPFLSCHPPAAAVKRSVLMLV